MGKLIQVDAGYGFNIEGHSWSESVITDESVLAVLEERYNLQIAFAMEYKEYGETNQYALLQRKGNTINLAYDTAADSEI